MMLPLPPIMSDGAKITCRCGRMSLGPMTGSPGARAMMSCRECKSLLDVCLPGGEPRTSTATTVNL